MPSTGLQKILLLLGNSSIRADQLLTRLLRLVSTTNGLDSLLRTTYYTLLLLHSQLTRVLENKYEKLAISIASKASQTMLPGETLVATIEPPHLALTEWCASVRAAGNAVEDARMFVRLFGLVRVYGWARETYVKSKRDPAIRFLTWGRIGAAAGYQFFENGAYLMRRAVIRGGKWVGREKAWWVWSTRCWRAFVVLSLLRLLRVRQLRYNEEWGAESKDGEGKEVKVQSEGLERRWWRSLYSHLGWIPSTLHYHNHDEETSPVSEAWIGASSLVPSILLLQDAWRGDVHAPNEGMGLGDI